MNEKEKIVLAILLTTQLLQSPLVTDKTSASDIITIMSKIIKEGF